MKNQTLHTGAVIGSYRLLHLVGFGPTSCVYLAEREGDSAQQVVFKLFDAEPVQEPHQQHFLEEARRISRLYHPSFQPFLSAGIYGEVPYVVRAYAKRGSLRDYLAYISPRPLPLDRALRILKQAGEALLFAHQHQIVHANLKPENILLLDQERVVLTDVRLHSLAKVIRTARLRTARGACYMAPEQFQGIVTPLSDQYAFACVAYELLTGRPPFIAADFKTQAYKHMVEPPLPPGLQNTHLPGYLDQVILKALEKWPDDRYADMQAFLSALAHHPSTGSFPAVHGNAHSPLPPESNKHAVAPALTLPQTDQADALARILPVTEKSPAMPSSQRKSPFPVRLRQFLSTFFAFLLRLSETTALAALVFLFDRLKKCRELLSLLNLLFSVLREKCKPIALVIRTHIAGLVEKFGAMLSRPGVALRRMHRVSRMRRRRLRRRFRPARTPPLSALPSHFPLTSFPAQSSPVASPTLPAEHFWTRRKLLFTGGIGLTGAGAGLSYLAYHIFSGNRSATTALMSQVLMPANMQATSTSGTFLPTQAKSLLVFTGHYQTVRAVAWSPDGTLLASGADDRLLFTWDLAARIHLRNQQATAVNAIAWAPDSRQLALAAANQVIFLNAQTDVREASDASIHTSTVTSLAWSLHQPQLLVSAGLDRLAAIWNTATFQPQLLFRQHTTAILSAAWASDGQTVGTCSDGGVTRVWNANDGQQLHGLFFDSEIAYTSVAFEPAGTRLAVGAADGILRLWQNSLLCQVEGSGNWQGECLDAPARLSAHAGAIRAVAWSPRGNLLASAGDDGALFIWEPAHHQAPLLKISHQAPVLAMSWSPDGKEIATASGETVTIWMLS